MDYVYGTRIVKKIDDPRSLITVDLFNPTQTVKNVNVKENIDGDVSITNVSHNGKIKDLTGAVDLQQLNWALSTNPGKTSLQYTIKAVAPSAHPLSLFNGTIQSKQIVGTGEYFFTPVEEKSLESHYWRSWNASDGLQDSKVRYFNLGPSGNAYVMNLNLRTGESYLNRFDGYEFNPIPLNNELKDGFVKEGLDGSLWFYQHRHLYQQKVDKKDQVTWDLCKDANGAPFKVTDMATLSFLHCGDPSMGGNTAKYNFIPISENVIYCLMDKVLKRYNANTREEKIILKVEDTPLKCFGGMILSRDKNLWITGEKGILKLSLLQDRYPILASYAVPEESSLDNFSLPIENSHGRLLMRGGNTHVIPGTFLVTFDDKFHPLDMGHGAPLSLSDDNNIWMLTEQGYDKDCITYVKENVKYLLPKQENHITYKSSDFDNEGNGAFWLSSEYGLLRYSPPLWSKPADLVDLKREVSMITEDATGTIWAMDEEYLYKYNGTEWKKYIKPDELTYWPYKTHSIVCLNDGRLAINTGDPIKAPKPFCIFDPQRETFEFLFHPDQLECDNIAQGNEHNLIMVLFNKERKAQLDEYKNGKYHTLIDPGENLLLGIYGMCELSNGDILIGSDGSESLQWFHEGKKVSLSGKKWYPGTTVFSILEIETNKVWVGDNNTIYEFNGERWSVIRSNLNNVYSMIKARDGSIWVASWTGLHRYKEGTWITYDSRDGFSSQIVNKVFEDSRGNIWAGTEDGIYLFNPGNDQDPPRTYIQQEENLNDFTYNGEVRIAFSGLDKWKYTPKEDLFYSYRINQEPWSQFSSRAYATYRNLPPRNYTLQVRAMDKNWNIDPTPATYDFRVNHLPIQARSWFVPLVIGTIGLILTLAIFAFRQKAQLAQFAGNLETMVQERTRQLRETEGHLLQVSEYEQQRIGQDLHDDVVQDLVGIALHQEILLRDLQPLVPEKLQDVQDILQQVDQATQKTRSLAKGLAPVNLEQFGLIGALQSMASTIEDYYSIPCVVEGDLDAELPLRHHHLALFRIVQEAINNAVKHAEAREIRVNVQKPDHKIVISIVDDGNGFDTHERAEGMGLQIMRYRAKNIGADLQIDSEPGKGTLINCILPINA